MFRPSGIRRVVVVLCLVALLLAAALPATVGHSWAVVPTVATINLVWASRPHQPDERPLATPLRLARTSRPRAPPLA